MPSTEVVTGPGSFPAPHENTIGENLISWFTHFFKWFEQNTNTRNKFCVETRIIFSFTCNIGFHQKMQIMDWLEIRYLSSFLFFKELFLLSKQTAIMLCTMLMSKDKGGNAIMSFISSTWLSWCGALSRESLFFGGDSRDVSPPKEK